MIFILEFFRENIQPEHDRKTIKRFLLRFLLDIGLTDLCLICKSLFD